MFLSRISDTGRNNKIVFIKDGEEYTPLVRRGIRGIDLRISGDNNIVRFELPIKAERSSITINCDNSLVEIGSTDRFFDTHIYCNSGKNQAIKIGRGTTINSMDVSSGNNASLIIGKNCMIATGVNIRTTDSHIIRDKSSGKISNKQRQPLKIGDNCWIGENVSIMKNAVLPNNTIVAANAVVAKKFTEEYTVIAGNPAKAVKTNVIWDRLDLCDLDAGI